MADKEKTPAADDNKIDHYVKMGTIAMGKHAMVLEVQEENTTNRFAMKVLLAEAMKDPEQVQILKYEGKVAQSLDHPNLIKWIATVHRKTNIYLILELFKALNVKSYLLNDAVGVQARLRKLIECTCLALQHMHEKGWVHLDVKPDNILMNRSSEVRVIDFSLSERIKGALGKMFGGKKEIGGTLSYIAPESIKKEAASPQTDIYSLGITIYECLTGTIPFKGSTPKDLLMKHLTAAPAPPSDYNKNVTPEMDRMVLRMIAKKPKDRQKNMQEIMSELRNVQPFKEDPEKLRELKVAEAKAAEGQQSLGKRLDSRTDHARAERAKVDPEFAKTLPAANAPPQPKAATPEPPKPAAPKPAAAPRPAQPPMPMPMPQMMPAFAPQMPFAPMPMPQMMPGQFAPMPGYPGMPQQMPGYGAGGPMPGMHPMQMPMQPATMMPQPGMPMPGNPGVPPQMPAMNQPAQAQPVPVQPPAPTPVRPSAGSVVHPGQRPVPPPSAKDVDDLPMMEELPDVM
ncbi:MAG: serine/threonine protein kinase [Planctomycetaceae bacterium]|nr:serine/threonine protein kinase [Planctomycetaceae bacterium]